MKPLAQAIEAIGARVVLEIGGAEEAVLAGVRKQKLGKVPFDGGEDGDKKHSGDQGNLPWFPILHPLPQQVERQCRHHDQDRKLRRHEMRYGIEHRAKLGLSGKERKDEDFGNDKHGIHGSR